MGGAKPWFTAACVTFVYLQLQRTQGTQCRGGQCCPASPPPAPSPHLFVHQALRGLVVPVVVELIQDGYTGAVQAAAGPVRLHARILLDQVLPVTETRRPQQRLGESEEGKDRVGEGEEGEDRVGEGMQA